MICYLCEEDKSSYRGCQFGNKDRTLCPDCLAQWQIENGKIVLRDRKSIGGSL